MMCFKTICKDVDADESKMAEQFLNVRSVKELVTIYQPVMSELGRSFTRAKLVSVILDYYTPDEVMRQYAYSLIAGNGRVG